ncbi:MAG TPA: DUF6090 family protein [Flavobacteriaceae bacterium]|nr:DUF6090 family protein [Flavobacteriaceae bacterium]
MIKFFRNIRKKLLAEDKIGNYLKYAIGEIVLVVIGILIALQINNWNENRKDRITENIVLTNLELDIEEDIKALQIHIKSQEIWIEDCVAILKHLENEKGFIGQDTLFKQINDLLIRSTSGQSKTTYETLKSTGKIDLIRNEALKKKIVLHYNILQDFSDNTINNNTNLVDLLINPVLMDYTVFQSHDFTNQLKAWWPITSTIKYQMQTTGRLQAIIEDTLSNDQSQLKLLNIVNLRLLLATIQKELALDIVQKSEQLLKAVKIELNEF